jgi:hypothetical protein
MTSDGDSGERGGHCGHLAGGDDRAAPLTGMLAGKVGHHEVPPMRR